MNSEICIRSGEVLADLRSAAWLEMELHPELDRHRRHEMADICEKDNVEAVWRILGVAAAEVRNMLEKSPGPLKGVENVPVNELESPEEWRFCFKQTLPSATLNLLKEKIHEYFVSRVMADRAGVIIPQCAGIWKERADMARSSIRDIAATACGPWRRVRRPLWPL